MKIFFCNRTVDKSEMKRLIKWVLLNYGTQKATRFVDHLKTLGFHYATTAGISLGIDDLRIPPIKDAFLLNAEMDIQDNERRYDRGQITAVERLEKALDIWNTTNETLKVEVINHFKETDIFNPVYMMAFSGARGNISQVRQLVGMRGLMADPQGQILDFPIRRNFREGLTVTEYMISCYGARKGLVDTALRTANSGYLTRRLVDVAQSVIIQQLDCEPTEGLSITPDPKQAGADLIGRVIFDDLPDLESGRFIARKNQDISPALANLLYKLPELHVRSPLTCKLQAVCQLCYGWNLAQQKLVQLGEAVGVLAAQSIGEPGTQLTMRTFHTGGVFAGEATEKVYAPHSGYIAYAGVPRGQHVVTKFGETAFLTFSEVHLKITRPEYGKSIILTFPPFTLLFVFPGQHVLFHQSLAELSRIDLAHTLLPSDENSQQVKKDLVAPEDGHIYIETNTKPTGSKQKYQFLWILAGDLLKQDYGVRGDRGSALLHPFTPDQKKSSNTYPKNLKPHIGLQKYQAQVQKLVAFSHHVSNKQTHSGAMLQPVVYFHKLSGLENTPRYQTSAREGQSLPVPVIFQTPISWNSGHGESGPAEMFTLRRSRHQQTVWLMPAKTELKTQPQVTCPSLVHNLPLLGASPKVHTFACTLELRRKKSSLETKGVERVKTYVAGKTPFPRVSRRCGRFFQKVHKVWGVRQHQTTQRMSSMRVAGGTDEFITQPLHVKTNVRHPVAWRNSRQTWFMPSNPTQKWYTCLVTQPLHGHGEPGSTLGLAQDMMRLFPPPLVAQQATATPGQPLPYQQQVGETGRFAQVTATSLALGSKWKSTSVVGAHPLKGEIRVPKKLMLSTQTQHTFVTAGHHVKASLGEFIRAGDELSDMVYSPYSGQVVAIQPMCIIIRRVHPYLISRSASLRVRHGDLVTAGSSFGQLTLLESKAGDIVQGLPKVDELLEAREPYHKILTSVHAQLAMFFRTYAGLYGLREGCRRSFQKIRRILVDEVQAVYREQGVFIADKHVEIIVRQMTTKVVIIDPGRTGLLPGDIVDLRRIEALEHKGTFAKIQYRPILLGITRASLTAESFISAASFQETKRVLARAAVEGRLDWLTGLKENVILGRLIPAGTGLYT
jgi:hypothetical protein